MSVDLRLECVNGIFWGFDQYPIGVCGASSQETTKLLLKVALRLSKISVFPRVGKTPGKMMGSLLQVD